MDRKNRKRSRPRSAVAHLALAALAACGAFAQGAAHAQAPIQPTAQLSTLPQGAVQAQAAQPATLREAFAAAWARQPEAVALPARREAGRAQQQAARAWTPEPAALELTAKGDRLYRDQGAREYDAGIAVPLWLPGERRRSEALADAETLAVESRATAAQLRLAAALRDAWWGWQRSLAELSSAEDQLANARRLSADVARRVQAGDLARADAHQAEGAIAAAQAAVAQAQIALAGALQALRTHLEGATAAASDPAAQPEQEPAADPAATSAALQEHPALRELRDKAAVAQRSLDLAAARSRGNPELTLAGTRERGAYGEAFKQTFTVGVRIPFGGGVRHQAQLAHAQAEVAEAQAQLGLEQQRFGADVQAAQARIGAARSQVAATERRALLAEETRGFFDKSFRLGETDLPTRLRIEAEAAEAARQAARARIELAAAVSALRQALGLLPQ